MAETPQVKFTWRMFTGLFLLFAVGNLVFANLFLRIVGLQGLVMGIVVSATMTVSVALFLMLRKSGPAHPDSEHSG